MLDTRAPKGCLAPSPSGAPWPVATVSRMDTPPLAPNPLASLLPEGSLSGCKYTESEKVRVLAVMAETNSARAASRITGVPCSTIQSWLQDDEVATLVIKLRSAIREQAAFEYLELVQLGQRATRKRLIEGDPHVTKDGTLMYVPVKARDAMIVTSIAHDKLTALAGGLDGNRAASSQLATLAGRLVTQLERAQRSEESKTIDAVGNYTG